MDVRITPNEKNNPPGKLADAEIHFTEGVVAGLKLIGFAVWERRTGNGRNVTFPARQYSVNGERRSFALLRPVTGDATAQEKLRELRGDELRKMNQSGMLPAIYAHLFSLSQIREVFARQVQQGKGPAGAKLPEAAEA